MTGQLIPGRCSKVWAGQVFVLVGCWLKCPHPTAKSLGSKYHKKTNDQYEHMHENTLANETQR